MPGDEQSIELTRLFLAGAALSGFRRAALAGFRQFLPEGFTAH